MNLIYIAIMAAVTYCIRMLPMVLIRRKIENNFIKSFLFYVPYAVLGAMTFPAILSSTSSIYSAVAGTITAIFTALKEKSLLIVALSACFAVYITEWLIYIIAPA
ncbi:MAG: AzlD domain-containing protein [Clostridiaceae bacterium]|nr:AzlD domain-containing protein [Clostridiaceae bacterium]